MLVKWLEGNLIYDNFIHKKWKELGNKHSLYSSPLPKNV